MTYLYGADCNISCPQNCVDSCHRYSAKCDQCKPGFWDSPCDQQCGKCATVSCDQDSGECFSDCNPGFYGLNCARTCPYGGCETCDRLTGSCILCKKELWGQNCENSCSPNCDPSTGGNCSKETGACDSQGCRTGFYNPYCTAACNSNCFPYEGESVGSCDFTNGRCDRSCRTGWHGDMCDRPCSQNCVDSTCHRDGECHVVLGCITGFHGFNCTSKCSDTCNDDTCDRTLGVCAECLQEVKTPKCRSAGTLARLHGRVIAWTAWTCYCMEVLLHGRVVAWTCYCMDTLSSLKQFTPSVRHPSVPDARPLWVFSLDHANSVSVNAFVNTHAVGSHGLFCEYNCSATCESSCGRYTLRCDSCDDGFYGHTCNGSCTNCMTVTCQQSSGTCNGICVDGYYTDQCSRQCIHTGCMTCDRQAGECLTCKPGLYGVQCSLPCSDQCVPSSDGNVYCNKTTGSCIAGACRAGYYGSTCTQTCPGDCRENPVDGLTYCDFSTGECLHGCNDGFFGEQCELECSENCAGQVTVCRRDGYCTNGCVDNHYGSFCGEMCNSSCTDNQCDRVEGICMDCLQDRTPLCRDAGNNTHVRKLTTVPRSFSIHILPLFHVHSAYISYHCSTFIHHTYLTTNYLVTHTSKSTTIYVFETFMQDGSATRDNGAMLAGVSDSLFHCINFVCPMSNNLLFCFLIDCPLPYYGLKCNETCAANCRNGDCDRYSARCTSCVADYWGGTCTQACGHCRGNICYQNNGTCPSGCDDGFYSIDCTVPCTYPGCQTCDDTGACASCKQGRYGTNCDRGCSGNCLPSSIDGFIYCSRSLGSCSENQCVPGYYSSDCSQQCSLNCGVAAGFRSCDIDDGECDAECELTWYGPNCRTICSSNCLNQNCNRTGECREGCTVGYWGEMCERTCTMAQTCNDGTCDQGLGRCLECERVNPSPRCRSAGTAAKVI
ncbi:MEG11-like protein [Mya arenaria]|uniref:MEG11-like protein n=1 Tax=Mya arenaria TaxID=6604 RepID=A0ABY7G8V6_MYAAR|nr:MEG11-like protein [Mya arenaria]